MMKLIDIEVFYFQNKNYIIYAVDAVVDGVADVAAAVVVAAVVVVERFLYHLYNKTRRIITTISAITLKAGVDKNDLSDSETATVLDI